MRTSIHEPRLSSIVLIGVEIYCSIVPLQTNISAKASRMPMSTWTSDSLMVMP